jgi:hypothetical protein
MKLHEHPPTPTEESLATGKYFHMSSTTRARMREELSSYADLYTLPVKSPFGSAFSFSTFLFTRRGAYAFMAVLLLLSTGAGTTYASEKSLPGDTLYSVKVRIAEPLQEAFIGTTKGKATWHTALAERRLDEAEQLASTHSLTATTSLYLAEEFNTNVDKSVTEADALAQAGKVNESQSVKDSLEATITAHAQILGLVVRASENVATSSSSSANSTANTSSQVTIAIRAIAEKVATKRIAVIAARLMNEEQSALIPLPPTIVSTPVSESISHNQEVKSVAASSTDSSNAASTLQEQSTTTEPVLTQESSQTKIQATVPAATANKEARQSARTKVVNMILERNQSLLEKFGIQANDTASSSFSTTGESK